MILPPWIAAGELQIQVTAFNPTALAASVPYTVTIETLDFARCPLKATADYVEASDGASNVNNDMVRVLQNGGFQTSQTTTTADVPEMPPLTINAGGILRLDGQLGINTTQGDIFKDRDVYALPTDASTHALDLRLAWSGRLRPRRPSPQRGHERYDARAAARRRQFGQLAEPRASGGCGRTIDYLLAPGR